MDTEVYNNTGSSELARAMNEYKRVQEGYQRMVKLALDAPSTARQEYIQTIIRENQRLIDIVNRLLAMWTQNKARLTEFGSDTIYKIRKDLEKFKKQLEELKNARDELTQLQALSSSLNSERTQNRSTFIGYIIACLVLLLLVFVMFVYTTFSSTASSWFTTTSVIETGSI